MEEISKYEQAFSQFDLTKSDAQIAESVRQLIVANRVKYDNEETRKQLLGTLELTTLTVTDSAESVMRLTEKVNRWSNDHPELPSLATICVYPNFAGIVHDTLEADKTKVACVSGGFPASQTFMEVKTIETALAIKDGAEEIDMVLSVGTFLGGDYETCSDEIAEMKAICGEDIPLKVILETGELGSAYNIKRAAILAIYSGADFIKTSTGKVAVSATPEAAYTMCQTIKEYERVTGRKIGFKAAGGIKTVAEAIDYYTIVAEVLGEDYIKAGYFRIGTSRLANLLASEVTGEESKPFEV